MKKHFIFCLLILSSGAFCQSTTQSLEMRNYRCWRTMDHLINEWADSLNFGGASKLPHFVSKVNFDQVHQGLTNNCFVELQMISFRYAILERVVNEEILEAIANSTDARLDSLYDPVIMIKRQEQHPSIHGPVFPEIPFMKFSTRQLAEKRLIRLRKIKSDFGNQK